MEAFVEHHTIKVVKLGLQSRVWLQSPHLNHGAVTPYQDTASWGRQGTRRKFQLCQGRTEISVFYGSWCCSWETCPWTSPSPDHTLSFSSLILQFKKEKKKCNSTFWGKWRHERRDLFSTFLLFLKNHVFLRVVWLRRVLVAVCRMAVLQHVGSRPLTRNWIQDPCIGSTKS